MGDQKVTPLFHLLPPLKFDFPLPASTMPLPLHLHLDWFQVEEPTPKPPDHYTDSKISPDVYVGSDVPERKKPKPPFDSGGASSKPPPPIWIGKIYMVPPTVLDFIQIQLEKGGMEVFFLKRYLETESPKVAEGLPLYSPPIGLDKTLSLLRVTF